MELEVAKAAFLLDKSVYCSSKTMLNYTEHLTRFLKGIPVLQVEELTPDHIRTYIIDLKKDGIRNVSINSYMRTVKVFCRWLFEYEYTSCYLFDRIKLPRPDAALKIPLSRQEVLSVDAVLNDRDKVIFHLMLDAGLRVSEVCNLKKTDVDQEHNLIRINNSKYNKSRIVPLAPDLDRIISTYSGKHDVYLLSGRWGDQLTDNLIKQLFQKLKKRSGVDRLHAHLLRHTFATSYIIGGGNLEKLRIMMGHADYNVTQNYLHLAAQYEIVRYPIYQLDPVFFEKGY